MNKKILTLMFGMIFLFMTMSFVSSESIGTFKQNENVELYQTCSNCTYVDFTSIRYPNSSTFLTNISTTKDGSYYYYILDSNYTTETGTYTYCYEGGNNVEIATGCLNFEITETGEEEFDTTYAIIILLISFGTAFTGFFGKNIWVTVIGGIIMIFFGIYTMTNGIVGFNNQLTEVISIISIGLGFFFTLYPLIEWIEDLI